MEAHEHDVRSQIIALEQGALERWCQGDPSRCLELSAPDVVYFDPFIDRRIDGIDALGAYYARLRGKIFAKDFELINPVVQLGHGIAVLTFNYRCSRNDGTEQRWNCTEVYRHDGDDGWRIIQTHWSLTNPMRSGTTA